MACFYSGVKRHFRSLPVLAGDLLHPPSPCHGLLLGVIRADADSGGHGVEHLLMAVWAWQRWLLLAQKLEGSCWRLCWYRNVLAFRSRELEML